MERLFRFKQFSLSDKGSPMKIGTDAVLLGAWTACEQSTKILDIGSGCGILALMLAQRSRAEIMASEPEENAFNQALKNFLKCSWADRISIQNKRIQDFSLIETTKFDLIVCNPPFFHNSLQSPDEGRNLARHNTGLTHLELLQAVDSLGTDEVIFTVILPADQETVFENEATFFGLCCIRKLRIRTFQESPFVRILMEFRRNTAAIVTDEMVLRNEDGTYSEGYQKLTREYHPHF